MSDQTVDLRIDFNTEDESGLPPPVDLHR